MDLSKLFNLSYLFEVKPGPFSSMPYMIGFFLIILLGSFYLERWINKQPNRAILHRTLPHIGKHFRWMSLIGFVLLWFRYESIPYLAIRFFLLAFVAFIVLYALYGFYKYTKIVPSIEEVVKAEAIQRKYLPKPKKKHKRNRR